LSLSFRWFSWRIWLEKWIDLWYCSDLEECVALSLLSEKIRGDRRCWAHSLLSLDIMPERLSNPTQPLPVYSTSTSLCRKRVNRVWMRAAVIELLCCFQDLTLFDPSHSLIIDHYFFERFWDSLIPFFGKWSRKKESNTFCSLSVQS